jgi:AcrR family transcriptional regulator
MPKGDETRERIVARAFRLATRDGLSGVTIGRLADDLGMSKSGLFAHFGSKEDLQVAVLQAGAVEFEETVVKPALTAPRGVPRLRALFERWLKWITDPKRPGGCIFVAATAELDDQEGRPRELLVASQKQLMAMLSRAALVAVEVDHFRSNLDCDQFAFDVLGILLAYNHHKRLLRDRKAEQRAIDSFNRLIEQAAAPL